MICLLSFATYNFLAKEKNFLLLFTIVTIYKHFDYRLHKTIIIWSTWLSFAGNLLLSFIILFQFYSERPGEPTWFPRFANIIDYRESVYTILFCGKFWMSCFWTRTRAFKTSVFCVLDHPIQDGRERPKGSPTSFFPWNVGTSPQNFVTFGFNRLPHWCKTSRLYLVLIPNYWTWTKPTPQKNCIFWSNPCTIVLMIPMISYQTLVTWPHVQYNLSCKIKFWWWRHEQQLWCHIQNSFVLRRARVANFAGVIQIATMFIKTTFKDLKK